MMKYICHIRLKNNIFENKKISYYGNPRDDSLMQTYIDNVWNKTFNINYFDCKKMIYEQITKPSIETNYFDKIYYKWEDINDIYDSIDENTYIFGIDCDDILCPNFLDKIIYELEMYNFPEILLWDAHILYHNYKVIDKYPEKIKEDSNYQCTRSNNSIFRKNKKIFNDKILFEQELIPYWKLSTNKKYISRNYSLEIRNITSLSLLFENWKIKEDNNKNDWVYNEKYYPYFPYYNSEKLREYIVISLNYFETFINFENFVFKEGLSSLMNIYRKLIF